MDRQKFFPAAGSIILGAAALVSCQQKGQKQYNILYIMTDDHSFQTMSCYDGRYNTTPNLDRIANEGVRFTNSFVANSLSGPSRACMLTGKHSCANRFYDNSTCVFDASQQTFPKLLQEAGYETAAIGKWHLESLPTGFDHWEIVPGQGDYYNPLFITQQNDTIQKHGYITDIITDDAIEWLDKEHDKSKPFCLLVHHKAIHRNWMADTTDLSLYEDVTFPLPETFYDDYAGREAAASQQMSIWKDMDLAYDLKTLTPETRQTGLGKAYEGMLERLDPEQREAWDRFYSKVTEDFITASPEGKELAEWKFQRYMRDYLKVVKSLDDNVGRLLDYLEENGLLENTLVVYTSDQGFYMGEHGWFDKRFMYEESMRTPLIMRIPDDLSRKLRKGSRQSHPAGAGLQQDICAGQPRDIAELVQNIDYAPTFLELAGVEIPDDIQGESLLPLLKGEHPADWRDALYYHYYEYPAEHSVKRHYGIRTDRYKLIHFYNDIDKWELYDLQNDPHELVNLYGKPGYEALTDSLRQKLLDLQEGYNDPVRFSTVHDR